MKNTNLLKNLSEMAKNIRGNNSISGYTPNDIALVLEEVEKLVLSQHAEYSNMLNAYLND